MDCWETGLGMSLSDRFLGGVCYEGIVEDLPLRGLFLPCILLLHLLLLWCHPPRGLSRAGAMDAVEPRPVILPSLFSSKWPSARYFTVDTNNGLMEPLIANSSCTLTVNSTYTLTVMGRVVSLPPNSHVGILHLQHLRCDCVWRRAVKVKIKLKPVHMHMEARSQSWMEQTHYRWTICLLSWLAEEKEEEEEEEKEEEEVVAIVLFGQLINPFFMRSKWQNHIMRQERGLHWTAKLLVF